MNCGTTIDDLLSTIYPEIQGGIPDDDYFPKHIILSASNEEVHKINDKAVGLFPGQEHVYHSADVQVQE
ncbi:hypothetical protein BOTBODRAFT_118284, partial [Botryobasidium botryosum FD-172 SS1]